MKTIDHNWIVQCWLWINRERNSRVDAIILYSKFNLDIVDVACRPVYVSLCVLCSNNTNLIVIIIAIAYVSIALVFNSKHCCCRFRFCCCFSNCIENVDCGILQFSFLLIVFHYCLLIIAHIVLNNTVFLLLFIFILSVSYFWY